jgi:hypothetical protein
MRRCRALVSEVTDKGQAGGSQIKKTGGTAAALFGPGLVSVHSIREEGEEEERKCW